MSVVFDRTPPASRHIKIFDMATYDIKFSQELHESLPPHTSHPQSTVTRGLLCLTSAECCVCRCRYMTYTPASEQFHTFEAQNCIVGLSFTDCNEANEFMAKVKSMLPSPQASSAPPSNPALAATSAASKDRKKGSFFSRLFNKSETPMAIGMPTDFVHKQHIGYDPDKGFQSTDIPAEWASIFKNAGIRRKDLQNPEIASVIYSTLQSQLGGSIELGQQLSILTGGPTFHGLHQSSLPHQPQPHSPVSPSVPARPTVHPLRDAAAGQKVFTPVPPAYPPSLHEEEEHTDDAGSVPPPPPPMLSSAAGSSVPPPPPPPSSVPPPPPPAGADIPTAPSVSPNAPIPPPFAPSIPPPPPPFSASSPPSPTASPPLEQKSASPPPVVDHLAAIKSGVTLKKVARPQADNALPDVSGLNREEATTLTSVLQNAMKARLRNIQAVEDDDEHDKDDDGWD